MVKKNNHTSIFALIAAIAIAALFSGCASHRTVNFKINSAPEGAFVVYRLSGPALEQEAEWIYLGNTPLNAVRQIHEDLIEDENKLSIKVMRSGYVDQARDWSGEVFWDELEEYGRILWAPQLFPSSE